MKELETLSKKKQVKFSIPLVECEPEVDKNTLIMKKLETLSRNELESWSFLFLMELNKFIEIINKRKPKRLIGIDENELSNRDIHWKEIMTFFSIFIKDYDSLKNSEKDLKNERNKKDSLKDLITELIIGEDDEHTKEILEELKNEL